MRIRPFAPEDATPVSALHARVYPNVWGSQAAYASYLREMLFHNPWHDPELPSWVAEEDHHIVGFFGVQPRRMVFGSRPIRVAVGCQFMVDPERRRGLAALQLMRRFLSGPQDLSVADGANSATRRLWEASGGITSPLHSLHWMRLLRPVQGLWQLAGARRDLRALAVLGAPFSALADACIARIAPFRPDPELREEELDARGLCAALQAQRSAFTLRPHYDVAALEWLLAQAKAKTRHGSLQRYLLRDAGGRIAGWFLYYLNGATSQVLQLGAARQRLRPVLERLFHHAWAQGAVALEGRLEPHLAAGLHGGRCLIRSRAIFTLLRARNQSLLVPFLRGDAFFTRLEGEWWMRFSGERAAAPADRPAPKRPIFQPAYRAR